MVRRGDAPMRCVLPFLLALVVLSGCGGGGGNGATGPFGGSGPVAEVRASFPPHRVADTIEIDAVERLPLRSAELIAPDGTATPAGYINAVANPTLATGQWAAGQPSQDAVTGNSALLAVTQQDAQVAATMHSQTQLLASVSTADIPLPDPVVYRRDWQHYRIRLGFGAASGEIETREIAAPAPPPSN